MFLHFLSFSFMFFHFLSFFFHFSFIFLSFSFIFFHFLSFSLLGAQNLFFLGLNFVTISLDVSHVKNQFLGPSRVVKETPSGPLLPFFPTFFFSLVFCFFLVFFEKKSLFLFISSFFDFFLRNSFFFSFFLYLFQILFIAGVSIRV